MSRFSLIDPDQEIRQSIDEGVFVSNRAARDPPAIHVGVLEIGRVNSAPTSEVIFDFFSIRITSVLKEVEILRVLQVKVARSILPVEFEGVEILTTLA